MNSQLSVLILCSNFFVYFLKIIYFNLLKIIIEAVKNKFPATFKKSLFGMAINNHITAVRRKNNVPVEPADAPEEPLMNAEQ